MKYVDSAKGVSQSGEGSVYRNLVFGPRLRVGPLGFVICSLEEALRFLIGSLSSQSVGHDLQPGVSVHFANAYTIALADNDPRYQQLLNSGALVFMDGQAVVWAAKIQHRREGQVCERVYGPDVMRGILAASGDLHRHFLLGSTPTILSRLEASIRRDYPDAQVVGSYSPPFTDLADPEELRIRDGLIARAAPTHIWVGLGTPKQDFEVARLAGEHKAFVFGVGAAFDFLSGSTPEAPQIIKTLGLQWAHRLLHEPRRLAKRYLWGNPRFVWAVLRTPRSTEMRRLK